MLCQNLYLGEKSFDVNFSPWLYNSILLLITATKLGILLGYYLQSVLTNVQAASPCALQHTLHSDTSH